METTGQGRQRIWYSSCSRRRRMGARMPWRKARQKRRPPNVPLRAWLKQRWLVTPVKIRSLCTRHVVGPVLSYGLPGGPHWTWVSLGGMNYPVSVSNNWLADLCSWGSQYCLWKRTLLWCICIMRAPIAASSLSRAIVGFASNARISSFVTGEYFLSTAFWTWRM